MDLKFLEGKTVLVTGSTGLIGSNLVSFLINHGSIRVIANGRSKKKLRIVFDGYLKNENLILLVQDVEKIPLIEEKVDFIFHAAGSQENEKIIKYPTSIIFANLNGLINCLEIQKTQNQKFDGKCRLIVFSSITIYKNNDNSDKVFYEEDTSTTAGLADFKIAYSESKRMCEVIAQAYKSEFRNDIVIARLSTVYGYSKLFTKTAFFDFISSAVSGKDIVIRNAASPKRDNIYIDDAISGLLKIAECGVSGEAYNISSNKLLNNFASIYDIAKKIAHYVESANISNSNVFFSDTPSLTCGGTVLDNNKLRNLGWDISTPLEEGIKKTIDKYVNSIYKQRTKY